MNFCFFMFLFVFFSYLYEFKRLNFAIFQITEAMVISLTHRIKEIEKKRYYNILFNLKV